MRSRNIKPGLFKNELLGGVDPLITILFAGLWCCADREGRLEDRPLKLCAEVFGYRRKVTERKVNAWLDWLHENKFIVRYTVGVCRFIQVVEFRKHQNPHRDERLSEIPPLSTVSHSAGTVAAPYEHDKSPDVARLIPDSGFLIPDSSLRVDARAREDSPPKAEVGNGRSEPRPDPNDVIEGIRTAYPAGIYRESAWLKAAHFVALRLDEGVAAEQLVDAAAKYCAQQRARGKLGTEFVLSPANFFESEWKGPFPLPATRGQAAQDANVDATREWLDRANVAS